MYIYWNWGSFCYGCKRWGSLGYGCRHWGSLCSSCKHKVSFAVDYIEVPSAVWIFVEVPSAMDVDIGWGFLCYHRGIAVVVDIGWGFLCYHRGIAVVVDIEVPSAIDVDFDWGSHCWGCRHWGPMFHRRWGVLSWEIRAVKGSVRIHFQFHLLPGILLCHFCHPLLLSFAVPFKTSVVYIMNSE